VLHHFLSRMERDALVQNYQIEYRITLQKPDGFRSVPRAYDLRAEACVGKGLEEQSHICIVIVADEYGTGHLFE